MGERGVDVDFYLGVSTETGRNSRCSSGVPLAGGDGAEHDRVVGDLRLITEYGFAVLQLLKAECSAPSAIELCYQPVSLAVTS